MIDVKEFVENPTAVIEGDTIKGVHILGFKSRNGRTYSKRAVKEAVALYEGKHVYTDHAAGPRKVEDKFGSLCNVTYSEENGLSGDLKFLASHPMSARVKEDVEKKLGFFGLSHDANVGFDKTDGKTVLMIGEVKSVDIVCDPATTKRIKEELAEAGDEPIIVIPPPRNRSRTMPSGGRDFRNGISTSLTGFWVLW